MTKHLTSPAYEAFVGLLFTLPFVIANVIVASRLEPFYSLLSSVPFMRTSPFLPLILLLLFPIGAYISIKPMFQGGAKSKRKFYLINSGIALGIMVIFLILFGAFADEFMRCNVLQIPNCD